MLKLEIFRRIYIFVLHVFYLFVFFSFCNLQGLGAEYFFPTPIFYIWCILWVTPSHVSEYKQLHIYLHFPPLSQCMPNLLMSCLPTNPSTFISSIIPLFIYFYSTFTFFFIFLIFCFGTSHIIPSPPPNFSLP